MAGTLVAKLEDEVVELGRHAALRVAPGVARSLWNEGPDDAELVIVSVRLEDMRGEAQIVEDFWPE
jgi:hypothetical protein